MIEIYHKRLYIEGQMSSKKQIGIMILLTVMIVAGGGAGWWMRTQKTAPEAVAGSSVLEEGAVVVVNGVTGETALEATRKTVGGQLEVSGTGSSAFVVGISGRKADSSKREFWEMKINGQTATVGAGSYVLQPGDVIEWRINTY
jgi:hypothetical protein